LAITSDGDLNIVKLVNGPHVEVSTFLTIKIGSHIEPLRNQVPAGDQYGVGGGSIAVGLGRREPDLLTKIKRSTGEHHVMFISEVS
jgi:hypothetical protein